jgi:putative colanic acid biosynthesis UDP-glucose lipid carrier transferase
MSHTKVGTTPAHHFEKRNGSYLDKENLLGILEYLIGPIAYIGSLWTICYLHYGHIVSAILLLTILVFPLVYPDKTSIEKSFYTGIFNLIYNYFFVVIVLLATGLVTGYITAIDKSVLYAWAFFAPITNIVIYVALKSSAKTLIKIHGTKRKGVIIGMNAQGIALANKIQMSLYSRVDIIGFLDSRQQHRGTLAHPYKLIGEMGNLANIIRINNIQVIYLSLPMASQPRIHQILEALKDTTASIYFVPDMFITDLIQGESSHVCGTPVISVCETPFRSVNGIIKTIFDYLFSVLILTDSSNSFRLSTNSVFNFIISASLLLNSFSRAISSAFKSSIF